MSQQRGRVVSWGVRRSSCEPKTTRSQSWPSSLPKAVETRTSQTRNRSVHPALDRCPLMPFCTSKWALEWMVA